MWIENYFSQPTDMTFENIEVSFCVLKGSLSSLSLVKHVTVYWVDVVCYGKAQ